MVNTMASHPRVSEISALDFHQTALPRTATIDSHNGPVAQMSDRGTRASVAVKEGTGANTARTPDTETKVEGMKIDNEFSDLSNDYTIQKFEFEIFWRETLSANSAILEIIDNGYKIPFFKTPKRGSFRKNQSALKK